MLSQAIKNENASQNNCVLIKRALENCRAIKSPFGKRGSNYFFGKQNNEKILYTHARKN